MQYRAPLDAPEIVDIEQNVYLAILNHRSSISESLSPQDTAAWLAQLAKSRAVDFMRSRNRRRQRVKRWFMRQQDEPALLSLAYPSNKALSQKSGLRGGCTLNETERHLLWGRMVRELSVAQLAKELGFTERHAYRVFNRILKKCRIHLSKSSDPCGLMTGDTEDE